MSYGSRNVDFIVEAINDKIEFVPIHQYHPGDDFLTSPQTAPLKQNFKRDNTARDPLKIVLREGGPLPPRYPEPCGWESEKCVTMKPTSQPLVFNAREFYLSSALLQIHLFLDP